MNLLERFLNNLKPVGYTKPPVPPRPEAIDTDLFGTYIKITQQHTMEELIGIQAWLKDNPNLRFRNMPVDDVHARAKRLGHAFVTIDSVGDISADTTPHETFRELTVVMRPAVSYYTVEPKTVEVLGNAYDKRELEAALKTLETK